MNMVQVFGLHLQIKMIIQDKVIIYLVKEKQSKMLPAMYRVDSNDTLVEKLKAMYGEKFVTKVLE